MSLRRLLGLSENVPLRHCFLRRDTIKSACQSDAVLNELIVRFEVPGKPRTLKSLSQSEKLTAIMRQIEHFSASPTSIWAQNSTGDILAAAMMGCRSALTHTAVKDCLNPVRSESELAQRSIAWLASYRVYNIYTEIALGKHRVDVLGVYRGNMLTAPSIIAVELKNEVSQLKRGLEQMPAYHDYANEVWLACTPSLAIAYLHDHCAAKTVTRWDPDVLHRRLERINCGLLLIERHAVYEVIKRPPHDVDKQKLDELFLTLAKRTPIQEKMS